MSLPDIETFIGHKIPVVEIDRGALASVQDALKVAKPRARKPRPGGGNKRRKRSRPQGGGRHRG